MVSPNRTTFVNKLYLVLVIELMNNLLRLAKMTQWMGKPHTISSDKINIPFNYR